jgi:hypothetical protein
LKKKYCNTVQYIDAVKTDMGKKDIRAASKYKHLE